MSKKRRVKELKHLKRNQPFPSDFWNYKVNSITGHNENQRKNYYKTRRIKNG
jgi:hypothetical protein